MRIALVTNGFFVTPKTEEIRKMLLDAFGRKGVDVLDIRNDESLCGLYDRADEFDTVLFWDKDAMLAKGLEALGKRVVNCSESLRICDDKGLESIYARKAGIDMPLTIVAPFTYANIGYNNFDFLDKVTDKLDFPIVVKESHGSFGMQVHLARDMGQLSAIVKEIAPKPMIFQQYVECNNSDLRLQVVGGKVVAAVRRASVNGDFRANATLGGVMTAYTPTAREVELALAAAECMGAEIAGVDILPGKTPMLCEVNANAHFKRLTDAAKIDVAGIIADYVLSL